MFHGELKLGADSQGKQHGDASTAGKQQIVIFEHTRIPDSPLATNVLLKGFLGHIAKGATLMSPCYYLDTFESKIECIWANNHPRYEIDPLNGLHDFMFD
jgi:hypothetical protein